VLDQPAHIRDPLLLTQPWRGQWLGIVEQYFPVTRESVSMEEDVGLVELPVPVMQGVGGLLGMVVVTKAGLRRRVADLAQVNEDDEIDDSRRLLVQLLTRANVRYQCHHDGLLELAVRHLLPMAEVRALSQRYHTSRQIKRRLWMFLTRFSQPVTPFPCPSGELPELPPQ